MKRVKILFLSSKNPFSKKDWSGIPYFMMMYLKEKYEVDYVALPRFSIMKQLGYYFGRFFEFVTGSKYTFDYGLLMAWRYGQIGTKLLKAKTDYRFVFVPAGLVEVAFLKTTLPIVSVGDCSMLQLFGYYPAIKNVSALSKWEVRFVEGKALNKIAHNVFSSDWAKEFVSNQYKLNQIRVIPFGYNLETNEVARERILNSNKCQLLFVGVDWERKGGDTALAIAQELLSKGVEVSIVILGTAPPVGKQIPAGINLHVKNVDKDLPLGEAEYISILNESDFFVLPTLADCTPIVISEAMWAGVPVLATNTGGINAMINHGVNGFLFSPGDAKGYVSVILNLLATPTQYQQISQNCTQLSRERLNWKYWVDELDRITASTSDG